MSETMNETLEFSIIEDNYKPTEQEVEMLAKELRTVKERLRLREAEQARWDWLETEIEEMAEMIEIEEDRKILYLALGTIQEARGR